MRNPYLPCLLVFCLAACETTVEVDVPRYPAQLTVNALFNPDSVWQVELSKNRSILDTTQFASVPDASVQIIHQGQVVTQLKYQRENHFGNSIYGASNIYPKRGSEYTLAVEHPALGSLKASSRVPTSQASIVSVVLDTSDVRILTEDIIAYGVTIVMDDPVEDNFYDLFFIIRWFLSSGSFQVGQDENGIKFEERLTYQQIGSDDPVMDNSNRFDYYKIKILFKDTRLNGGQYKIKVYLLVQRGRLLDGALFNPPTVLDRVAHDVTNNIIYQPRDTVDRFRLYTILRTTTKEYYDYFYTRDLQASVENNPFAQPVQVFDNIQGGLGVFAGYSQTEKEVTIK
ncbi:MAG: DUF4249 domain-containing protein [Tunicatimonas sp.]